MMVACFTSLNILILMVAEHCFTITDCADSGRKRERNLIAALSTHGARRLKSVRDATSSSEATAEAGSSSREKHNWTRELDEDILNEYYNNLRDGVLNWNTIYKFLRSKYADIPPSPATHDRVHKLLEKLIQATPANGEGNVLWTSSMKSTIIKIYYQTRGGDEKKHALDMYNMWRNEQPLYADVSPMDLLHQAENMLMRHELLQPSKPLSKDRMNKIFADKRFKFNPEQEEIFRKICDKLPLNKPIRKESFYDELCKEDLRFSLASPQKLYKKAYVSIRERNKQHREFRAPDVTGEGVIFLDQRRQGEHHHFYEFLGVEDNSLVHSQSAHHHAQEIGSSSSHQGSMHDHPDLDLRLASCTVGTPRIHHPDVDLELGLSSRKNKGKSIWKQGSSEN